MAISTQDGLIAAMATGQGVSINRSGARTTVLATWFQTLDLAGSPGAGVLAGTSTAAGVVPTDATVGCPVINAFTGSNTGYLGAVDFGCNVACRLRLCDMLWKGGAYAFNAAVTLASQPSFSTRAPAGDYKGTEIWIEAVTAFTGNQSIAVTYTNEAGTAARTTGTIATGVAPAVGRMLQLPLQAGDTGVQKIESVTSTISTVGTFNVLVLRPLWMGRVGGPGGGGTHSVSTTEMPIIFTDSAIVAQIMNDAANASIFEINFGVLNG